MTPSKIHLKYLYDFFFVNFSKDFVNVNKRYNEMKKENKNLNEFYGCFIWTFYDFHELFLRRPRKFTAFVRCKSE